MIDSLRSLLQNYFNLSVEGQTQLFISLLILLLLWILRLIALRFVNRRFHEEARALYNWRKVIQYVTIVLAIFLIGRIWLEGIQSLATYLGLLSAGVAIALQDPIVNLAGWGYILWQRPFRVGDRIEIGDKAGDVIDISLLEFTLLEIGYRIDAEQSTGRLIHVPNGMVFKQSLANAHQGVPFIWNEIPVLITFESDWEKAKNLLTDIIRQYAPDSTREIEEFRRRADKRWVITYRNVTPTVYTEVAASGVLLTMRYLINPRKRRSSEQVIWEAILKAFASDWDIDFAYETRREYFHWREARRSARDGKSAAQRKQPRADQADEKEMPLQETPPAHDEIGDI